MTPYVYKDRVENGNFGNSLLFFPCKQANSAKMEPENSNYYVVLNFPTLI